MGTERDTSTSLQWNICTVRIMFVFPFSCRTGRIESYAAIYCPASEVAV